MEKVYAIITMYKPNISDFVRNLEIVSSQVEKILVLDNDEDKDFYNLLIKEEKFFSLKNVKYIQMKKNLGLGAINVGVKIAQEEQANYVLLLDQDSTPEKNMVSVMIEFYKRKENILDKPIAAIGPTMINKRTGELFKSKLKRGKVLNEYLMEVDQLPTSGMLIPIRIFDDVGGFCEELFLDVTDFEWCWRAKAKGYKILKHRKAFMRHELGEDTKKMWFIEYNVPSPERQYYLFRNSIFVIMCDYAPTYVRLRYLVFTILKILAYNLFLTDKRKRLKYTIEGLKDGIKRWILISNACISEK